MGVNSIIGDVAAFTLQPLRSPASLDQSSNGTPLTNGYLSKVTETSSVADVHTNNTDSPVNNQAFDARIESNNKQVRAMSHVLVEYNMQGNVRIKFMDSNSNVIYQIPTEMVAKIEDQMMKLEGSTTVKG